VRWVLNALTSRNLFVVSGAGLAIPIIPAMSTLARQIVSSYMDLGSYPARRVHLSEIKARLLPPLKELLAVNRADAGARVGFRVEPWRAQLLLGVYDEALVSLFQRAIYREIEAIPPVNYRALYYVKAPTLLFDFNNDTLLRRYISPPHIVLNPHGSIERRLLGSPDYDVFIRAAVDFGLEPPNPMRIWYPRPEPKWITERREYSVARRYLSFSGDVFLSIGYSFGRTLSGTIDDVESFEFFRDILKRRPRRVVVLDPQPEHVVGLFEDALRQRIYACRLYWDCLASAICQTVEQNGWSSRLPELNSQISKLYDARTR